MMPLLRKFELTSALVVMGRLYRVCASSIFSILFLNTDHAAGVLPEALHYVR